MIKVVLSYSNQLIKEIVISGHANSAVRGQDLVCAGVSSISIGMLNAIENIANDQCELSVSDGFVKISVKKYSEQLSVLLHALVIQLETIQKSYQKYIKITKQEV